MKHTAQIIALILFGTTAMQIILGIGSVMIFFRLWANKIRLMQNRQPAGSKRQLRRFMKEMERNNWTIE